MKIYPFKQALFGKSANLGKDQTPQLGRDHPKQNLAPYKGIREKWSEVVPPYIEGIEGGTQGWVRPSNMVRNLIGSISYIQASRSVSTTMHL